MRTVPNMFEESVKRFPNNTLMWEHDGQSYKSYTYTDIRQRVHQCAAGLIKLGVKKGDRIALMADGRRDWLVSELGLLYAGGISVPLSVRIVELNELSFRLEHSGCRYAIVSATQLPKVREVLANLNFLEKLIILDDISEPGEKEMLFSEIMGLGSRYLDIPEGRKHLDDTYSSISEQDLVNICYTSGTTAQPKGIMLSNRNYTANVAQAGSLMEIPSYYVSLIILPWDHSFAHTVGLYTLISNGAAIAAVQVGKTGLDTLKNIPRNIREIRPTFLLSVPALARNFKKNIEKGINEKGPVIEKLFRFALRNAEILQGDGWKKPFKPLRLVLHSLFDRILFRKIRAGFGGRIEFFIGGGALLDIELQRFFYAIGMPMFQGYGLTEAAPIISSNAPARHKLGSSGFLVSDLELRICDENGKDLPVGQKGEIVVRGENVMLGYWRNEEASREALKDGWLHTGDMGYLDEDGFLYVLGRFKSLLIGNDGEKYSPEGIEEAMVNHSRIIEQCILHNNQNAYTVALVVPNADGLRKALLAEGIEPAASDAPKRAIVLIEAEIDQYLSGGRYSNLFPDRWIPSAFAVLDTPFTQDNQLVNSTGKVVRAKVSELYANRLELLYTPEGKNPNNSLNLESVSKFLK
jgi:long-chain acyl-CoA synthetase